MLGDNYRILPTIPNIVAALAAAGIHSADCPEGQRNANQKHTGMYLTHQPCKCWVESKDDESTYVCD